MSTPLHTVRRLTIYTPASLSAALVERFMSLGAKGYTTVASQGKGDQGTVEDMFARSSHVRIELIVQPAVADKIMNYLAGASIRSKSIIATSEEVQVIDPTHF